MVQLSRSLAAQIARHHGIVTRVDLLADGYSYREVERSVGRGTSYASTTACTGSRHRRTHSSRGARRRALPTPRWSSRQRLPHGCGPSVTRGGQASRSRSWPTSEHPSPAVSSCVEPTCSTTRTWCSELTASRWRVLREPGSIAPATSTTNASNVSPSGCSTTTARCRRCGARLAGSKHGAARVAHA